MKQLLRTLANNLVSLSPKVNILKVLCQNTVFYDINQYYQNFRYCFNYFKYSLNNYNRTSSSSNQVLNNKSLHFYDVYLSGYFRLFPIPTNSFVMGKGGFYAVARGRTVGVYHTWDSCNTQVKGFPNARFKKFASNAEAEDFILQNGGAVEVPMQNAVEPSVSTVASSAVSIPKTIRFAAAASTPTPRFAGIGFKKGSFETDSLGPAPVKNNSIDATRKFSTSTSLGKRSFKVTDERVINKRMKQDVANNNIDLSNFSVDEEGYVIIYTDGACKSNGRRAAKAGIGVWFGNDHPLNVSEPVHGRQTNNTAEIQAAEQAILKAKSQGINKINIQTDSQFTINCVTKWMPNWKKKNWKLSNGQPVKNKEDLEKLEKAMNMMEIKWSYVAGHKGHHGNEEADRLAVLGSTKC